MKNVFTKYLLLLLTFLAFGSEVNAQCTNSSSYGGGAAPTSGSVTLTTCQYETEYSPVTGVVGGTTYQSTYSLPGAYCTVRSGTFNGPVVANGFFPLTWTATVSGNYFIHCNTNASCGTGSSCSTHTLAYVSGGGGGSCTYTVPFSGNNSITASSGSICDHGGTGAYANSANGYTVINPSAACQAVRLTFTAFSTEASFDFVTIYDGVGTGGTVLYGPTSGTPTLPTVTSTSGPLTILFTSDGSVTGNGFSANITNVPITTNPDLTLTASCSSAASVTSALGCSDGCTLRIGPDKVIAVTIPSAGDWTFSTCTSPSADLVMYINTARCGGTQLSYTDDVCGVLPSATLTGLAAGTYYVDIEPFGGAPSGTPFTLQVTGVCAPVNPPAPTSATATPSTINCPGASVNLVGTSTGNTIRWYTVATGGTNIGTSASGANFAVAPTGTTTYYAESYSPGGVPSLTRTPVTVTLDQPAPTAVTATPSTACPGATVQLNATNTAGTINWYTVPTGGTAIGTSASAANFAVTPSGTTTYYAESQFAGGGCTAPTRTPVTVTVPAAPTISTPSAQSLTLDASCGGALPDYTTLPTTTGTGVVVTQSPAINSAVSGVGAMTVTLTATDGCSRTATSSFTVNKVDATPPALSWTGGTQTVNLDASCAAVMPDYTSSPSVSVSDNCAASVSGTAAMPAQSGTFGGNVRGYWFTAPVSFTMTSVVLPTTASQNIAVVRFTGAVPPPLFSATTNAFTTLFLTQNNTSGGPITVNIPITAGDVIGLLGSDGTTNSYATGPATTTINGSTVTISRLGMQFPLNTTAPQDLWTESGGSISRVTFTWSVGSLPPVTQSPPAGSPLSGTGSTTVTLTATDASSNTATTSFTLNKVDNTAPATPTLSSATGQCSVTPTPPTTTDACAGTITGTTSTTFPITTQGTTVVTWTFSDGNGNTTTATQSVVVDDTNAPTTPTLSPVTGQCSATATAPTTTDACAGTITGTTTDPLSYSTQGSYLITWMFDDGNGNSTTATQSVVVDDTQAPTPDVASLPAITANCGVTLTAPTATDGCAGPVTGTTGTMSFSTPGTNTVTWTYDDGNGNTSTQTQSVTVTAAAVTATSNSPVCTGSDLQLMSSGSGAGSYVWTGPTGTYPLQNATVAGATPTSSGTWSVTWTSSAYPSCTATSSVNVFVGPITLAVTPNPTVNTEATAVVSNCTSPYTIFWRTLIASTWSSASSASNSYTMSGLQPATAYMAYAVDANGATTSIVYFITSGVPFCGNSPTATAIPACNKVFVDWSGGNLVDINGNPYTQWVAQIQRVSPTLGPVVSSGYVSTLSHVFTIPTNGFGGTYQVTVSGMCNNQYSVYSNPVQVVVNDPRPLAPTVTPTSFTTNCPTVGAKTITVNWTPSGTGPAALGGWRVRAKTASSTGGYNIVASTTQTAINTLTFTVAANTTYKVYVEPMGCSNLVGAPSQVYLVTSCAQPNGNATLTTVRLDETQNYDDLITDEENNNVDIVLEAAISVYPNPNNGAFTVSAENILDETAKIEVMNMLGQVVYTQEVSTDNGLLSHEINLSNESTAGTYLVRITTKSGSYHTKFVKM